MQRLLDLIAQEERHITALAELVGELDVQNGQLDYLSGKLEALRERLVCRTLDLQEQLCQARLTKVSVTPQDCDRHSAVAAGASSKP